jgi:hypothetical protein
MTVMNAERPDQYDEINQVHEVTTDGSASSDPEKLGALEDLRQIPEEETKPVDVPPDGGYGWVCVVCVALMNAHTWGVNSV